MSENKKKDVAFMCRECGEPVPNNNHWRIWAVFIGEICKKCKLKRISEGEFP